MTTNRYINSQKLFLRAQNVIPLASQTFSKSYLSYPKNQSPLFLTHGKGSYVWDVDGNKYIDLVNGLLPNILGYDDVDVIRAVKKQLTKGITLSLPTELEILLSEKLVNIIPCAEKVRFGKNGSDVTSAAIRIARSYTKKKRIAVCGYHGWQDWYIGSTPRDKGVPSETKNLTHKFEYNNLQSLDCLFKKYPSQFAAVILEPMNFIEPKDNFLKKLKEITNKNNCLLIFDEICTGFRFHIGGAQKYFNVKPDLACFGKSMGNGFPISALVGKKKYMKEMENIFFSTTFGGETLSIAASLALIKKMENQPVIETIWENGSILMNKIKEVISDNNLDNFISINGKPCWSILTFKDFGKYTSWELKTLFLQEVLLNGILTGGANNICYSHTLRDIYKVCDVYTKVLIYLKKGIENNNLKKLLKTKVIEPIFKVR